jgi:hypothetical protein
VIRVPAGVAHIPGYAQEGDMLNGTIKKLVSDRGFA